HEPFALGIAREAILCFDRILRRRATREGRKRYRWECQGEHKDFLQRWADPTNRFQPSIHHCLKSSQSSHENVRMKHDAPPCSECWGASQAGPLDEPIGKIRSVLILW